MERIDENGGIDQFTTGYKSFGIHINPDNSVSCLEWAPGAQQLFLTGDFNGWNRTSHPFKKLDYGKWQLVLPPHEDGSCQIKHLSEIKIAVQTNSGSIEDRLSPWASYVVQPPKDQGTIFKQRVWHPPQTEV